MKENCSPASGLIKALLFLSILFIVSPGISTGSLYGSDSRATENELSLAGTWELALDSLATGPDKLVFNKTIQLPGIIEDSPAYTGKAWYRKKINIPSWAKNKTAFLTLERVFLRSTIYIDGKEAGSQYSVTTPHKHDLTEFLNTGQHEILICTDNSGELVGSYYGRTNIRGPGRNGIRGEFKLSFFEKSYIINASIFPNADKKNIRIEVSGKFRSDNEQIRFTLKEKKSGIVMEETVMDIQPSNVYTLEFHTDVTPWDEFSKALYILESTLMDKGKPIQSHTEIFGFRKIETKGKELLLNGTPAFLRGNCGMDRGTDVEAWERIFRMARAYGLNYFRILCPSEAAFEAADRLGIYLQIEFPTWDFRFGSDSNVVQYVADEAVRIRKEYGNHPSFIQFVTGNELSGDYNIINKLIADLKAQDNRILYATTNFTFQLGHGMYPEPADDYFITQWTDAGWIRGQGYFDLEYPGFDKDYYGVSSHIPIPIILHELGQHTVYPNVKAGIMPAIKADLEKKGLSHLVDDYINASGKLQVLLYKEEIERALKTQGISGFQLLAIQDMGLPIGVIDGLWNPKRYIDSIEFRRFCSELVPLAWFEKAVYSNAETMEIEVGAANFYKTLNNQKLICEISDNSDNILQYKELRVSEIVHGRTDKYGRVEFNLADIQVPGQLKLSLRLEGTAYRNSWPVWVYPDKPVINDDQIMVTASFDAAERALDQGRKVLLSPPLERIEGNEGVFITVFWSPTHFDHAERVSEVGTMGLLIDPDHPAFSQFPTEFHSNWQWWDLCKNSQTIDFDTLDIQPLVRIIDNYTRNRNLTSLFEVKAGNGKLLFSSIDLITDLNERIEARQLRHSLIRYMKSDRFEPQKAMSMQSILQNFKVTDYWMYPAAKHCIMKRSDQQKN